MPLCGAKDVNFVWRKVNRIPEKRQTHTIKSTWNSGFGLVRQRKIYWTKAYHLISSFHLCSGECGFKTNNYKKIWANQFQINRIFRSESLEPHQQWSSSYCVQQEKEKTAGWLKALLSRKINDVKTNSNIKDYKENTSQKEPKTRQSILAPLCARIFRSSSLFPLWRGYFLQETSSNLRAGNASPFGLVFDKTITERWFIRSFLCSLIIHHVTRKLTEYYLLQSKIKHTG